VVFTYCGFSFKLCGFHLLILRSSRLFILRPLRILRIKGVIGFFCNGGKPEIVPDKEMDTIQISLKNGKNVSPVEIFGNYSSKPIYSHRVEAATS